MAWGWVKWVWKRILSLFKKTPDTRPLYTLELAERLIQEMIILYVQQDVGRFALDEYTKQDFRAAIMRHVLDNLQIDHLVEKERTKELVKLKKKVKEKFDLICRADHSGSGGKCHPDFLPENMWRNYQ